nr:hypothetical protein [Tanacetum cinerariifolium]
MLEDLGIKDGSILFSHFRIPGKSLDEGLVPLMSNQDVLSLLQYVPIFKEIEVYVENNTMEVVLCTIKGIVIKEVMKDDEVKEASKTGNSGKQLLDENEVKAEQEMEEHVYNDFHPLMYEDDLLQKEDPYVPIFKEIKVYVENNTMEVVLCTIKGIVIKEVMKDDEVKEASKTGNSGKQLLDENEVKAEQEMEEHVYNDFHPLMYEDDLLQKEDPVNYQQDPYHGEDEAEENAELFDEQDHLLENVPFLKETVIIVDGDASLQVVDALVVPLVMVLDEQLERPNRRRKLNPT